MPTEATKDQILEIARNLLVSDGLAGVSFDAIARQLNRTKQAVLYWYPTKQDLLAAMFLPYLEAEADVATKAVAGATDRNTAIAGFVRAVARYHFDHLDRFRMMYLLPQTLRSSAGAAQDSDLLQRVHLITGQMYTALAERLEAAPDIARQEAFAIHSAVLGTALMFGLGDSLNDPMKHPAKDIVDALIAILQGK